MLAKCAIIEKFVDSSVFYIYADIYKDLINHECIQVSFLQRSSMEILFYRYGSICEADMINAFCQAGLNVLEDITEITEKLISDADRLSSVERVLKERHLLFVFSINFYPVIADICHAYRTLYLCQTVDSPVPELFSSSICHDTNRIFLFDYAQYEQFAPFNLNHIFHLPLASCTERFRRATDTITEDEQRAYSSDISFVGSLYNEKNPLNRITTLSEYVTGYIQGLVDSSLQIYGCNLVEQALPDNIVAEIKKEDSHFYCPRKPVANPDSYIAAHSYIGMEIAQTERIRTLNLLGQYFSVDLYTRSDTSVLKNIHIHGGVQTLTEMPKIFHLSKINLNMTIKPIQTGLPLRIFDILGCGGFLMTNYQSEIQEYFEIGVDLEAYSSMEELVDKCSYYLAHEDTRKKIAEKGYQKVDSLHTYPHRIREMIRYII